MFAAGKTKGVVATAANYIEDVFSTWLYNGNGSTQTITNGIDLSTKGGLVWTKSRSAAYDNWLNDTARGISRYISSDTTDAQIGPDTNSISSVSTTGYTLGSYSGWNNGSQTYVSWTIRKQPKFFDVVTWTGNGVNDRAISHSLASAPGCILIKRTDNADSWYVYHRSLPSTYWLVLNSTAAQANTGFVWTTVTSTTFTVPSGTGFNASGGSYVAYLFAHDAGGFGLTGTDNVISCGSFTTDANGQATVNLGYEPQWVLVKNTNVTSTGSAVSWCMTDNMRGMPVSAVDPRLFANTSGSEDSTYDWIAPTATGFVITPNTSSGDTYANSPYIYIAIRRGPMKVPTDATKVFLPTTMTGNTTVTTNFPVDLIIDGIRNTAGVGGAFYDRLRGSSQTSMQVLFPYSTSAETNYVNGFGLDNNTGYIDNGVYGSTIQSVQWNMRRAPSFFDEVCYTGTGSGTPNVLSHNLGVTPELIIGKNRSIGSNWFVYSSTLGATKALLLNDTSASFTQASVWNSTNPTSTTVTLGGASQINDSGQNGVLYLFATCAGVSKVGSYTGNGTTQTINCGFTGGARFVLIKRTDSTGGWYVYDTARGMTTLTDPYLLLNSTAAESATLGSVTTVSTGFAVNASILAAINTNGASYIFLAIA